MMRTLATKLWRRVRVGKRGACRTHSQAGRAWRAQQHKGCAGCAEHSALMCGPAGVGEWVSGMAGGRADVL